MAHRSSGVALITVLLVVAIATVLGVTMARQQHDSIRYTTNQFDLTQARQYALGGEELARQILWQDFTDTPGRDDLTESWADPALFFEFENGDVSLQIEDLQGRINLNNIAQPDALGLASRSRLQQLAGLVGLDPALVDRILDWIDVDVSAQPLGAEDYVYLGLDEPYRTSGQFMVDASEMRLLMGMDAEMYSAIVPFVATLPDEGVPINVNTAGAAVLQSLTNADSGQVDGFISQRESTGGFESVQEALASLGVDGGSEPPGLSVQSAFFEVRVRARFNDRFAYLTSIVQRDPTTGAMVVIYRDAGKKILPVVADDTPVDADA